MFLDKNFGWAGSVLEVDLTAGSARQQALSKAFAREYLGGSGFNSARLFELLQPGVEPLSRENVLMFGVGTLTGTLAPGSARLTVTAKSPLTDIFGDSNMGGHWSTELKFAGYDQLLFFGKAARPTYLWIDNGMVDLRDAGHLWGLSTWETARRIREDVEDPFAQVICIGPAGENLVRVANIMCPTKRAAGRAGMGAVMGSKNLKAIAVRGGTDIEIAHPKEFLKACMEIRQTLVNSYPHYESLRTYGTPGYYDPFYSAGVIGVKNYQQNTFQGWAALSREVLKRDFYKAMRACASCPIACGPFHSVTSGEFAGTYGEGPEYADQQLMLLMGCDNPAAMLKYQEICNQEGLDVYGVGCQIAWAMECYEKGILTEEDFEGRPLSFGDYEAVLEAVPKIARRRAFGAVLGEGPKRAPELVGKGSEQFMYHVKGQAPVMEDSRAHKVYGLQNLTGTRGADHLKGNIIHMRFLLRDTEIGKALSGDLGALDVRNTDGVGEMVKWGEDLTQVVDSLGVCTRTGGSIDLLVAALCSATGLDFPKEELLSIGERIFNLQKAFNAREGLTREDDNFSVPTKFLHEPVRDGPCRGSVLERDLLLDDYYEAREWDVGTGLQTREKLVGLGLGHVAEELNRWNALSSKGKKE